MSEQQRNGTAIALADLVNAGVEEKGTNEPERETGKAVEPRPAAAKPRRRRPGPAKPTPGGWAGPVAKTKIQREPLNAGLPMELDLMRRLRRYRADTGVEIQDFVAAVLHEALEGIGYGIDED